MARVKYFKPFNLLSPEEQIKWIEKQTEKVLNRLPTLKERLTAFDDRSDELYNKTVEEIKLTSKVYTSQILDGDTDIGGLENYIDQLTTYGNTNIKTLVKETTKTRLDNFLENILLTGSPEEYEYVKKLLSKMTNTEKNRFVKSKYFFDTGNLNSDDFVKFLEEFDVTVGTAKLESFLVSIGRKELIDNKFFIAGETRVKLGRPKKR